MTAAEDVMDHRAAARPAPPPVRAALLRAAHADAERRLAEAHREAATVTERAGRRAAAIRLEARRAGARDGAGRARLALARARASARARVLEARREAYEELRRLTRERVRALRQDPGYPRLTAGLTRRARGLLGPDAAVEEAPCGGVVARSGGRWADWSLDALADRAVERLGFRVPELWEP
ncbi:hypothetical protein I3F58_08880 [Streptomyces sp. MUM 203J]|uniref:hypothetical protein n=1 Tax=Streptomyces sp. MUM 203J TaxID=2791990 RepID=UPI001F03BDBB|nr:hypothetical protein [Streptomyces sp. MUM 203J]MCH0539679.1 hypothetical protein [Streptomyces sp. MUM 203J]